MHVSLPEKVNLVTIDASWTRQSKILPHAGKLLSPRGQIITLIKPHYEADPKLLRRGALPDDARAAVLEHVRHDIACAGFVIAGEAASPIKGGKGNTEILALLRPQTARAEPTATRG